MNKLIISLILGGAILITSGLAFAESNSDVSTSKVSFYDITSKTRTSNNDPQGWVPFAAAGFSAVEFDSSLTDRDGTAGNARMIGSYYNQARNFVFDTGLGVESSKLVGDAVTSGLLEVAGRLRFGNSNKWQVGPVVNMNFANDVGIAYGSSSDDVATFAGAQLVRDFAVGQTAVLRGGLKAMTDVGIPNSVANKFLFELQLGAISQPTAVSENHEVVQEAAFVEKTDDLVTEELEIEALDDEIEEEDLLGVVIEAETIKVPASIYFATGAEKIGPRNRRVVKKLAEILKNNKGLIEGVRVTGFSDQRGNGDFNKTLSMKRAETVANELMTAGLGQSEIESIVGEGELTAEQVNSDLRRARRVDLEIMGVSNSKLLDELKALRDIK